MDIGKDMAEKITHRIRISHHIKKHHRAYVLGGFSIFAIVQTISLLSGIFSKASHDFMISDNPIIQSINEFEETSSFLGLENNLQDEISGISSIANIFSDFFDGNINNDLEEEESENTEKEIVSLDINNIQTFVLDDPWDEDFDKLSGDILDFSRDSDLVQDSKVLKNISIEKSQKNNNTISVQIPKDTFVKEIVSSSSLGKPRELNYKGEILAPQELSQDWLKLNRIKADYAFEVGNSNDKIIFKDEYGSESFVKISVELDPDKFSANEKVWIKSSNDQVSRDNLGTYPVQQKIEDKKEILFVEFVVNHMTTFVIGKYQFNFFLGESDKCDREVTEFVPNQEVFACVQGDNLKTINWMRFSLNDEIDLDKQEWIGFQNGYRIVLPKDFGESLDLYAHYIDDPKNIADLITKNIYQGNTSLDIVFFLGNDRCDPIELIDSTNLANTYMCLNGEDVSKIKSMRFAMSLGDLDKATWINFENNFRFSLGENSEGETTVFAHYGVDDKENYVLMTGGVLVKRLDSGKAQIYTSNIDIGQSVDFGNKYREILSSDEKSKLVINTVDKNVNLSVSVDSWDGILYSPIVITDNRKAEKGEPGLASNFEPRQTILVGAESSSLALNNGEKFDISFFVQNASPGEILDIYYSNDGTNWTEFDQKCTIDQNNMCNIQSTHMTLFVVGSIVWENFDFVNQRFWDQGPSSTRIIDAFFGVSVGSRTAYSRHWRKSVSSSLFDPNFPCRPSNATGVVYLNPGTRNAFTVPANTIYVLRSGHYIQNGAITMSTCSALVGSGNVTISKNGSFNLINASSVNQVILDNLSLNGSGNGNNIINFNTVSYFTINDVQAYGGTSNGIYVSGGADGLLNNIQSFNNNNYGLHIITAQYSIVNNSQIFNNGSFGFYSQNTQYSSVNNSQIFNNGSVGMYAATATGWMISNTQVYKNSVRGIYVVNTPNFMMNNVRSFHNATYDLQLTSTASSGLYYGKNLIPSRSATHFYNGSVNSTLGWSAGALSTFLPAYDCDLLSRPLLDNNPRYPFYLVGNCNYVGRRAAWTVGKDGIVKYTYGDNFLSGNHVLKQVVPVNWYVGGDIFNPVILNQISSISYHGHRFVGEYDDPSNRDRGNPIVVFDSNNPPNGTNVISGPYSNNFTIKTYIYEPNLYYFPWAEHFSPFYQNNVYEVYDDTLALMLNFDRVAEIGETTTLVRDLSRWKNKGTVNGGLTWTSNGKWNGAYQFNGTNSYISFPTTNSTYLRSLSNFSIAFWIKTTTPSITMPVVESWNWEFDMQGFAGFAIEILNNGRVQFRTSLGSSIVSNSSVSNNNWNYVSFVRSGNVGYMYINSALEKTGSLSSNNLGLPSYLNIGFNINNSTYFSGFLDEFRLYKRALSESEIQHFLISNLSAKANNWEYVVNYTGVQNWQMGNYTYNLFKDSYNGIKDSDNNEVGGLNGNVVKNYGCNGNFSISWGIDRYLSGNFWSQNPNNCDIIYALYGTGGDKTNYGNHCSTAGCHWSDMTVQYLSPGTNQIPQFLNSKTIYVLSPGNYIQTYSVNMGNNCTALVGGSGTVTWYNNTSQYEQLYILGRDIVVDNIVFHGSGNGVGGFVSPHEQAILHNSTRCSTANNVNIFGHQLFGINSIGSDLKVSNSNIYNIWGQDGALLSLNSYSFVENTKMYNGARNGISIAGSKNKVYSGTEIFNIDNAGIRIDNADELFLDDVQIYNTNQAAGINIVGASHYHTFNNVKIFDNDVGIQTSNDNDSKEYITINNSQIFNNNKDGLSLYSTRNFTINNTHIYNNGQNGILFEGSNNSGGILNDVFSYNNGGYGVFSYSGSHTRYGLTTIFNNGIPGIGTQFGSISAGNSSTYAQLGRTGGTTDTTPCMNCSWISNPRTSIGSQYMIDTTLYPKCDVRGNIATWTGTVDTSYRYGVSLTGQQKPVFWYDNLGVPTFTGIFVQYPNSTNNQFYNIDYDTNKYVAEDNNKITPDYTNTQCTCTDVANYPWNNDNFLNGQFWGSLPTYKPYCHIIASLYGSGTNGNDRTAYTQFWNNWTGACNVENMEVIYTGQVPETLADNTIYVVTSNTQNISLSRNMANCSAILGLGDLILKKTANIHAIASNGKTNWIVDNLSIDGNAKSNYGLRVSNSPNNTINNTNVYRNTSYGAYFLSNSNYNRIHNSSFYNNGSYGLYLATQRNVVNNVQIYNNNNYGLVVNSAYNTINNLQSYNNRSHGIYAGSTNNVYNNIQTYNNNSDGVRFMTNTTTNVINNLMSYNNALMGINTQNYQVTYFGDNRAFDNGGANTGTNLIAGNNSSVGRANGTLAGGTLNWDFMTNPLNTSNTYLLNWSGSLRGRFVSYYNAAVPTQKYSYGSGILTQIQPVYYDNITLKTGGLFTTNKYIGSDTLKVSGTLLGLPATFVASNVNVSGNSMSDLVGKYSIFGDVMSYIIESNIGTTNGINLVLGLPKNRVVTQLLGLNWGLVGGTGFSAGLASSQSLAIDGSGIPYVAYRDAGNGNKTTVMKYNGSTWVSVGNVGFSAGTSNYQSLAIDGSGVLYVAYADSANGGKTTAMKYNGSSWVNVGSPGFSAGSSIYQSLAIDGSGTPYVAYADGANGSKSTVMKYNGSSWVNVGSPGFSAGSVMYVSLKIDAGGTPYVAYADSANGGKTTAMKYNGSSWVNVGSPGFSAGWSDYQSLAIDGSGIPYVAYRDAINGYGTTVMKYNGSSWVNVGGVGFPSSGALYQSLVIDGNGIPYVAYRDGNNGLGTTVMKYNGSAWVGIGSPGFPAGGGSFQSLAIDGNGVPYVAYREDFSPMKTAVMSLNEEYFATHFQTDTKMEMCLSGWNNDNFIDDSFWAQNPSDLNILCAIYGSGGTDKTAYTQFWKGGEYADDCGLAHMNVVHVTNPNNIPFGNISSNTVYVFPSGSYNLPNNVYMEDCSAFISSGDLTIRNINNNIQISRNYIVLDNINIDANGGNYGLLVDLAEQISLHNMNVYNAEATAIEATRTTELYLDTVNIFNNNKNGIFSNRLFSSIFNNINVHNNKNIGILLEGDVFDTTINNSKIYNNYDNIVMILNENSSINNSLMFNSESNSLSVLDAKKLLINNSMIFDSANNGLVIEKNSSTLLANTYIYNNANYGVVVDSSSSLDYGGKNYSFSNYVSPFAIDGYVGAIPAIPEFGWSDGEFYDDGGFFNQIGFRMSWDYLVNVLNDQNEYMLKREPRYDVLLGQVDFDAKYPLKYSYGSGIIMQSEPVLWDSDTSQYKTGLSYNSDYYIGSTVNKYTGSLQVPDYNSGATLVTGIANLSQINKYNIHSTDLITSYLGNIINNPILISFDLNNGDGIKKIVTQIENTNNQYFATHFENESYLDATGPTFTFNNNSGAECVAGNLSITSASDAGVGLHTSPYSFNNGSTRQSSSVLSLPAQQPGTVTKAGIVRDALLNQTIKTATYTFNDTMPTANNFTGHANVGSGAKTVNWKTLSDAKDGACGAGDMSFDSIVTQGARGVCSVNGNNITYTPNQGELGNDLCVIKIKDNEGNMINITVGWGNISSDTTAPTTTDNANSTWRKTDLPVTLTAVDTGVGVAYTLYCTGTTTSCTPNITGTSLTVTCESGTTCPQQYVRYRSVDQVGNTESIKTSPVIRIDKQGPTFTFNNNSGAECVAGNLSITSASDAGVGLHTSPYSFNNGSTRQSSSVLSLPAQQPGIVTRTGYVRDALSNQTIKTATYTFNDTMPTANNFTGHANVGSGAKTVNWKTLSDAKDGACGAGDMSFDSIVTQGARGVCSVNGNNITYTPNEGQVGNDSCVIRVKDNEGNMINITVGWGGIQFALNPIIFFTGVNPVQNFNLNQNKYISQIQVEQTENMGIFDYIFDGQVHNVYDSGLVLMYNFDKIASLGENDSTIKDISQNNYTGTNINNAIRTANSKFNGGYKFNGIDQYIDIPQAVINSYPFTVSAWVKPSVVVGTQGIFFKGRSGFNNIQYGINLNDATFQITARNPLEQTANGTITAQAGQRYHVVGVFASATSRTIYVNGIQGEVSTDSVALHTSAPQHRTVAKYPGTANNYFSGEIDEVRVYDHALSAQEIQFLYKSNLSKIDTDKWLFETLNTCLGGNDSYLYTGYVENIYNQFASTGRKLSTNIQGLFATGLSNFDFGVDQVSSSVQIKTGQYNDYIEVHDKIANTGWRLTVSASNQLLGQENSFNIASSNLFFMPNNLDLLSGSSLPNTLGLNPSLENRSNIHVTPIDYFIKDFDPNDFMCDEGVFGDKPHLKLNIPAHQAPDTYVGTLYINIAP